VVIDFVHQGLPRTAVRQDDHFIRGYAKGQYPRPNRSRSAGGRAAPLEGDEDLISCFAHNTRAIGGGGVRGAYIGKVDLVHQALVAC
jgi:hypothetical protein